MGRIDDLDRITVHPDICCGEPCIRNTRITLGCVWKLLLNPKYKNTEQILAAYPELELEDLKQVLAYKCLRLKAIQAIDLAFKK